MFKSNTENVHFDIVLQYFVHFFKVKSKFLIVLLLLVLTTHQKPIRPIKVWLQIRKKGAPSSNCSQFDAAIMSDTNFHWWHGHQYLHHFMEELLFISKTIISLVHSHPFYANYPCLGLKDKSEKGIQHISLLRDTPAPPGASQGVPTHT